MSEARITINGVELASGQAMALRVAVSSYYEEMADEDALGSDAHGRRMTQLYRTRLGEVLLLLLSHPDLSKGGEE